MKVEDHYFGFWFHSVWTGEQVRSLRKGLLITFDMESTVWRKNKIKG